MKVLIVASQLVSAQLPALPQAVFQPVPPPVRSSPSFPSGLTVSSGSGAKPAGFPANSPNRNANVATAMADRQAVFRNDCAKCHAEPARGKLGAELYAVACGICHDSPHRAAMVPDLRAIRKLRNNPDYWRHWITNGKPGGLMPGFAQSVGGPLTEAQLQSLLHHLIGPELPSIPQPAR